MKVWDCELMVICSITICHFAECHILSIVMLNVIMLCIIMLSVTVMHVIMQCHCALSVMMTARKTTLSTGCHCADCHGAKDNGSEATMKMIRCNLQLLVPKL